jgi:prepilin-type N-terminal cleavage/methylation domain-containing protein
MPRDLTRTQSTRRRGYTLPEMLIVIVIVVLVAAMAFPATAKTVRHGRINQAVNVVANDLETAVSYAARQRRPVRIAYAPGATSFTIADRRTGTVLRRRELGTESEWKLSSIAFSASAIDVVPAGITSAPLTVRVGDGSYSRQIQLTRAGFVQVVQ